MLNPLVRRASEILIDPGLDLVLVDALQVDAFLLDFLELERLELSESFALGWGGFHCVGLLLLLMRVRAGGGFHAGNVGQPSFALRFQALVPDGGYFGEFSCLVFSLEGEDVLRLPPDVTGVRDAGLGPRDGEARRLRARGLRPGLVLRELEIGRGRREFLD